MAKAAKTKDIEISDRLVNKIIRDILEKYSELETARGSFMNRARRIREGIQGVVDEAAARGIPPKLTKLTIKIEQAQKKLQAMMAELDAEERKLLKRIVVAHGDKAQLQLFNDLPPAVAAPKEVVIADSKAEKKPPKAKKAKGVTGEELAQADQAAGKSAAVEDMPEAATLQ